MFRGVQSASHYIRGSLRLVSSLPKRSISANGKHAIPVEEERVPYYKPEQFYPIHIGQVLDSRYKVVGKLGFGAHSTVWLCRDTERKDDYVSVKVGTRGGRGNVANDQELEFYKHVAGLESEHKGQNNIRGLFGAFEVDGPAGSHLCLVQPPMHMTIAQFLRLNASRRLSKDLLNWVLYNILNALSFFHNEAKVTHADINPSNVMLTIADESLFTAFEQAESDESSLLKVVDDSRSIYRSRKFGLPKNSLWGQPCLCDFGEARVGGPHKGLIQPELYRAPEVLFDMTWGPGVDIWNIAVLIWDLFEGRHLFRALDESGESSASHHVSEIVAYLGLPSKEYLTRSAVTKKCFDEQGQWLGRGGVKVPDTTLAAAEVVLKEEDKQCFLAFVKRMLTWQAEDRASATELLTDPWMKDAVATYKR